MAVREREAVRGEGQGGTRNKAPGEVRSEARSVPFGAAAKELRLKPREFELAVRLGVVRTLPAAPHGKRRVAREEIERHTADAGFPEALRARVWTLGTTEGAALMGISPSRFGRLARAGRFAPVTFYVNRYRAVVWLYLAAELAEFADREPDLLTGRVPLAMREALDAGEDRRARGWRHRRREELIAQTEDPWERAASTAALLDLDQLSEAVPDSYERTHLRTLRPDLSPVRTDAVAARDVIEKLTIADDPDEIAWLRFRLTVQLEEAREVRPALRPEEEASLERGPVERGPESDPELAPEPVLASDPRLEPPRRHEDETESESRLEPGCRPHEARQVQRTPGIHRAQRHETPARREPAPRERYGLWARLRGRKHRGHSRTTDQLTP